jgi:hypothetical protein
MSVNAPIQESDYWFVGADKTFRYTIVDANGAPQDVTGWTFTWVLRQPASGATALISKTLGSGISVVGSAANGVIDVAIAAADTASLASGTYFYTLWRTNTGSKTELAFGDAVLRQPAST